MIFEKGVKCVYKKYRPISAMSRNFLPYLNFCMSTNHSAEPDSSVSRVADLITGGRWFDPRLDQYFSDDR